MEIPSIPAVPRLTRVGESECDAVTLFLGLSLSPPDESERAIDTAVTFVLHFLADGPKPTIELNAAAQDAGLSIRTVERARARLRVVAIPPGHEDRRWYVKLPEVPDAPPTDWAP